MIETNKSIAAIFRSIADLLEIRRDNPHRIRAYRRGAESLLSLSQDVGMIAQRGELQQIPGIGRDLSSKIEEFLATGRIQAYEALKMPLPPEVAKWASLPGLSETIVQHLYFRLRIRTLSDLEMLVRSHMLRTLPEFTGSEEDLLSAIQAQK